MRIFLLLLLAFTALCADPISLSKDEKAWVKNHKEILFAGDPNWLPYEAFDEDGEHIGIVAEHLKLIEITTGLRFLPQIVKEWSESLKIAAEGKVSVVSGDVADKVLSEQFRAIDPYLINPIVIVMDNLAGYVEDLNILQGKKVAVIKGYGYTAELFKNYPQMSFIEVDNIQEGMNGVSDGRFDAMLASISLARYSISQMGLENLRIVGKTSVIMEVTLFVDKKEPLLYNIINKAIHAIPTLNQQKIVDYWNNQNKRDKISYLHNLTLILLAMGVMAILFIFSYKNLKKKKEHYKFAIAGSDDALWHWDIKKDHVCFSPRFKEILGFEDQEYTCDNAKWTEQIHPDDKASVLEEIETNLQSKRDVFKVEYRMLHRDGSWKWIRTRAKAFFNDKGEALRMDGICSDVTSEKNLSLELFKSQELLKTILENIPVRIFWKDTKGLYLGCNKLFSQDIDPDGKIGCIGKTDHDMPWKEEAQGYIDDDREVMQNDEAKLNYEEQQTRPDGQKIWLSTSKVPLKDPNGNVIGILGTYYDITEHKHLQLENEKRREILESAQEINHLGSWEWDMITGELLWSDEVYRIFGEVPRAYPATYEAFKSYLSKEDQEGLEKTIAEAIESKKPYQFDHHIRRKDGSIRLVREAGYVRFDDNTKPVSMLGTVLDINTLVEVKSTQRENIELTDLLKKFDENVIASNTDTKGIITYASKAFSKTSGYSIEELVGSAQNIVRHRDMPKELFEDLWKTIQSGQVWSGELKNRKKDGSDYWVYTTISPIFDKEKSITGYSSIRRDISYEKQVKELHSRLEKKSSQLLSLNKDLEQRIEDAVLKSKQKDHLMAQQSKLASMGEMIGNIAHQWRQPLNALGLLLQKQQIFFDRGLLTSQKLKESVDKGTLLINKMSSTIDDFRDFFKPNKEKTDFDLKEVVDDTLELIDAALYNQNITVSVDIKEGQKIHGYKNEFAQVVLNLINNAKDALENSEKSYGEIRISSSVQGNTITLQVCDNAGGIAEGIIEHIFEPYYTTKEEGKGTGIGLYMSKMIIEENMGGKLSVDNDDKGAVFTISIGAENSADKA